MATETSSIGTHHTLDMPASEAQIRALRIGDTVTLNHTLFGIRDATQIHMFDHGRTTRFDLRGHAVIHTAPNVRRVACRRRIPQGMSRCASARRRPRAWNALPRR